MSAVLVACACAVAMVLVQDALPGAAVYHSGWYNVLIAAAIIFVLLRLRALRKAMPERFGSIALAVFGAAVVGVAGIASGLLAPDTAVVAGVPGSSVRVTDLRGSLLFPLSTDPGGSGQTTVRLVRGNARSTIEPHGRRYSGGFILWQKPRRVVYVAASDLHGNRLTITQPTNATFLSPVLLMQGTTTIAGMRVAFDSFAVPALRRNVKALLLAPSQVERLHVATPSPGDAAVLFAVADDANRPIPGAIGIVASGATKRVGDLQLRAQVETYPAVVVASAPYLPALILGLVLFFIGTANSWRMRALQPAAIFKQ